MKKILLLLRIVLFTSIAVFISIFIDLFTVRIIPLQGLLLMLKISLPTIFVCIALIFILPHKEKILKSVKSSDSVVGFWKGLNIFLIIGDIILLIPSIILGKENWLFKYSPFPPTISVILQVMFLILSILIVYGIKKKIPLGYYISMVYIGLSMIRFIVINILNGLNWWSIISVLIVISLLVGIGYELRKNKTYFGIKK